MMPSVVVLVLYALAVARITTLITHDEVTRPARAWLIARVNPNNEFHRALVYLFGTPDDDTTGCPWCVSIWVGATTAPIIYYGSDIPAVLMTVLALAASQTVGMIYQYGRRM